MKKSLSIDMQTDYNKLSWAFPFSISLMTIMQDVV